MFGLGTRELIIIAALAVLLFGSKKIPELSKSIVEAIKHMRGAFKDVDATQTSSTDVKKKS
ncbi:MAG: twin-arginine translocase TatA/TatE family subunit [Candidatus Zambryskibacteria bacterium]|nr:twin-arginine translocase TatA/TatE family subunit [Candidatus Zambryskibacteria bacterium]